MSASTVNPPPDAAEGPGKGPHLNGHDDSFTLDGTSEVDPNQHNRWACCALDRIAVPCPRCCRCWRRDLCEHRRPGADLGVEVA